MENINSSNLENIENISDQNLTQNQAENNPISTQTPQTTQEDKKSNKLNLPKRKYAIIHGYNGHNYSGNQKSEF
jgi:hypothetical protein